jgi:hypothetical protein
MCPLVFDYDTVDCKDDAGCFMNCGHLFVVLVNCNFIECKIALGNVLI